MIERLKSVFSSGNSFVFLCFLVISTLPVLSAFCFWFFVPGTLFFIVLVLLLEASFFAGLQSEGYGSDKLSIVVLSGLVISLAQGFAFFSNGSASGLLFSVPVYLWAWISMFVAGLEINPKSLDNRALLVALVTTLASVGTMTCIWISIV